MLVDDDELLLHVTTRALSREGMVVAGFCNPLTARSAILRGPPDLVLTDFEMPGLDGVALARDARASLGDGCPPFVLWTGSRERLPREAPALLDAVIDKPCRPGRLVTVLRALGSPRAVTQSGVRGPLVRAKAGEVAR